MKKKILCVLLCVMMLVVLGASMTACVDNRPTIVVYNWGEYMSIGEDGMRDINAEFTAATGIRVEYLTYQTNEELYTMLSTGGMNIDVIFPSDYMIGRLIEEDMLEKLDFTNIPNAENIDEEFRNLAYDPTGEYSIPYMWGTVGIFYNSKHVSEADVASQSWDLLWNEKYAGKVLMFDNPRDSLMIAQKKLGYSMNTTNEAEIRAAYDLLAQQKSKKVLQGYFMDQTISKMSTGEAWIAPYYAGDGADILTDNPDVRFYLPKEGTNYFFDAMCIPKACSNKEGAEAYINFLCQAEVSAANAEAIGYATPISAAKQYMDPEIVNDPMFYPPSSTLQNTEVYVTLPTTVNKLIDDLWIDLKTRN